MGKLYIEHQVTDMDDSLMQVCSLCGALITDYNGSLYLGQSMPKGFPEGKVYVLSNSRVCVTTTYLASGELSESCTPLLKIDNG
jgi:hypothetical protein